jgi:hypothetical protein
MKNNDDLEFLANNERPEYILCAAIYYQDGKVYPHQPKNIDTGIVACGRRHHNCFSILYSLLGDNYNVTLAESQGFLTSKDRYVTREEGAEIAFKSGQIKQKQETMFSEDLY